MMRSAQLRRVVPFGIVVLLVGVGVGCWLSYRSGTDRVHCAQEQGAFGDLRQLALEMIQEGGDGLEGSGNAARIKSFHDFFEYVTEKRPTDVSTEAAPNPFPGILTERSYQRRLAPTESSEDLLLWSDTIHGSPFSYRIQYGLTSGGPADNLQSRAGP